MINLDVEISDYNFNCECCGGGNNLTGSFIFNNEKYSFFYDGHLGGEYKGEDKKHNINLHNSSDLFSGTSEILFNLINLICEKQNYKILFYPLNYAKEREWIFFKNDIEEEEANKKKFLEEEKLFNDILIINNLPKFDELYYSEFIIIMNNKEVIFFEEVKESYFIKQNNELSSLTETLLNTLKFLGYNINLILKEED